MGQIIDVEPVNVGAGIHATMSTNATAHIFGLHTPDISIPHTKTTLVRQHQFAATGVDHLGSTARTEFDVDKVETGCTDTFDQEPKEAAISGRLQINREFTNNNFAVGQIFTENVNWSRLVSGNIQLSKHINLNTLLVLKQNGTLP